MRQKSPKISMSLFCIIHLLLCTEPALKMVFMPSGTLFEETDFSCEGGHQWETASGLGMWALPTLRAQSLSGADVSRRCACCQVSLSSWVIQYCYVQNASFPWCSYNFCAPSSTGFPEPRRAGVEVDIPFRTVLQGLSLIAQFCISVFIPISCKNKFLRRWLSELLIYEQSRMSLEVILLQGSFWKTLVLGFILGTQSIQSQVLRYPSSVGHGFDLVQWALNSVSYWFVNPTDSVL